MKTFLFAALSLVSGFSKDQEEEGRQISNLEIEKSAEFMIEGKYENINNLQTLSVNSTGIEDYMYTFDVNDNTHVYKKKEEISFDEVKSGDTLRITYDGSVSLEYPPRLNNISRIEVIENENKEEEKKEEPNSSPEHIVQ